MTLAGVVQHLPAALTPVEAWISDRRTAWERRFDRLGDLLADDAAPEHTDPSNKGNTP